MGQLLHKLNNWGCDINKTLHRFLGNEQLYCSCLSDLVKEATFEKLQEALLTNNGKEAFSCAHTLKGVIANMGITPMLDIIIRIVEPLRELEKSEGELSPVFARQLLDEYEQLQMAKEYLIKLMQEKE